MTIQYSGQGRERLITAAAATSDANGLITFRVGPCPLGFVWQGSVTVTNAPSGALFNSSVASTPWGQHAGPTNFGPVQLWGNETLIVSGVGLQKNTQYSMLFFGVAMPEQLADPLPPVAPLSTVSVETTTPLVIAQTFTPVSSTALVTFTVPSLTRRLTLLFKANNISGPAPLFLKGDQTGIVYWAGPVLQSTILGNLGLGEFFAAIEPSVDQTYTLFTDNTVTGTITCWVLASTTNPLVMNDQYMPLYVTFGSGSGSPIPFPVTGNPTTSPFKSSFVAGLGGGNNQVLIAAPGGGLSIYLQGMEMGNPAAAAAATVEGQVHSSSGTSVCTLEIAGGQQSDRAEFPGGFELPTNTGLQIDVITTTIGVRVSGRYAIGPSL